MAKAFLFSYTVAVVALSGGSFRNRAII